MSSKKLREMLDIQVKMPPEEALSLLDKNALPDNVQVLGDLDLIKAGKTVASLPKNLKIYGDLSVSLKKMKALPKCIRVDGDVFVERFLTFRSAAKRTKEVLNHNEPICMWVDIPLAGGGLGTSRSIEYLSIRHAIEEECSAAGLKVNGGGMGLNKMDISFMITDVSKDVPRIFKSISKHKLKAIPSLDIVYHDEFLGINIQEVIRFKYNTVTKKKK